MENISKLSMVAYPFSGANRNAFYVIVTTDWIEFELWSKLNDRYLDAILLVCPSWSYMYIKRIIGTLSRRTHNFIYQLSTELNFWDFRYILWSFLCPRNHFLFVEKCIVSCRFLPMERCSVQSEFVLSMLLLYLSRTVRFASSVYKLDSVS